MFYTRTGMYLPLLLLPLLLLFDWIKVAARHFDNFYRTNRLGVRHYYYAVLIVGEALQWIYF